MMQQRAPAGFQIQFETIDRNGNPLPRGQWHFHVENDTPETQSALAEYEAGLELEAQAPAAPAPTPEPAAPAAKPQGDGLTVPKKRKDLPAGIRILGEGGVEEIIL